MGSSNGATRGQLRPYLSGRTPPFLLVGLFVILGILGFSYWSLNTQFTELQSEIQKLEERLRVYAEKRVSVEKMNSALQAQMQTHKEESKKLKITLYKRDQELSTIAEQLRNRDEDLHKANLQIGTLKSDLEKYDSRDKRKEQEIGSLQDQAKLLKIDNQELGDAKAGLQKKFELFQEAAYKKRKNSRNFVSNNHIAQGIPHRREMPVIPPLNLGMQFQSQNRATNNYIQGDGNAPTPVPNIADGSNIDKVGAYSRSEGQHEVHLNDVVVAASETNSVSQIYFQDVTQKKIF